MLSVFDGLRDVTTLSVFVRLACALICGGIIGIERSYKRRPAGFRTHILICIGAAITTLTSQYLYLNMHYFTDMARLGAQVVAGIGFIGAGTIIVTKRQRVKGLTTAAGLWTSAIIGLTFGRRLLRGRHSRDRVHHARRACVLAYRVPRARKCAGDQSVYGIRGQALSGRCASALPQLQY